MNQPVSADPPISEVLKRFSKPLTVAHPTTFHLIKQTYANAIEYTGVPVGSRGLLLFVGLVGTAFCLWMSQDILFNWVRYSIMEMMNIVDVIVGVVFGGATIYLLTICARLELYRCQDPHGYILLLETAPASLAAIS